jgi:DNA repair protein RadD
VLTTGFDAPHVDCIAILRKTESAGLWAQIIGRGLRLDDGKSNCLILDYTTNIDDHFPDGDLFDPKIEAKRAKEKGDGIGAECPECGYENSFTAHRDYLDMPFDANGYILDLAGNRVMTEFGPLPAHYGRRCFGMDRTGPNGTYERCGYRWTFKPCDECEEPNDIAARYCCKCKAEIVDPNSKLVAEFKQLKRDPSQRQTDKVLSMDVREGVSANGNKTVRVDFVTPYRSFSVWFVPESKGWKQRDDWARFAHEVMAKNPSTGNLYVQYMPSTVTYRKDTETGFYRLLNLNEEPDREPEETAIPHLRKPEVSRQVSA